MKQNKRFWLVALVVLLAMTLVAGMALAAKPSLISVVRGGEKNSDGSWKQAYEFFAIKSDDQKSYVDLKDKNNKRGSSTTAASLRVVLPSAASDGDIVFDFEGNQDTTITREFIFEADKDVFTVTTDGDKKGATLAWTKDEKTLDKEHKLTITAIDGYTKNDKGEDVPVKGASATFTIKLTTIKVLGMKIKDDDNWVSERTFTNNLTDYPYGKLNVATGYEADGYTPIIRGTRFGFVRYSAPVTHYTGVYEYGPVNIQKDVEFEIVYEPENAKTLDPKFVEETEKNVVGFKFEADSSSVGKLEQPMKYSQIEVRGGSICFDWEQKVGKVAVVITPVDKDAKAVTALGTATAILDFKEIPETAIEITSKDAKGNECKVLRIRVNETESVYSFNTYDEKGEPISVTYKDGVPYEGLFKTEIHITDEKGNKTEPTYVLPGADNVLQDLIWSSSDPSVIRVTKDGKITGIKVGTAEAIATGHFGVQGKVKVEVIKEAASKITSIKFNQNPAEYELIIGSGKPIRAYVITEPAGLTTYEVESSDPNVVRIQYVEDYKRNEDGSIDYNIPVYKTDEDGNYVLDDKGKRIITGYTSSKISWLGMMPLKKGTATITVYPNGKPDLAVTATVTVVESEVKAKFYQDEIAIALNEGTNLSNYLKYNNPNGIVDQIIWTSSDPEIVTMSGAWASANKVGSATVTVTLANSSDDILATASIKVNVGKQKLTGVAFDKDAYTVTRGKTADLRVTVTPLTESWIASDYTYEIDDEIADYYFSNGKVVVEGLKPGTTTLTMTNKDDETISAKATITVEQAKIDSVKLKKDSINLYIIDRKNEATDSDNVESSNSSDKFSNYVKVSPDDVWTVSDAWTYTSSDESIALVTDKGTIYATGIGTATITGTYDDGLNKAELKLEVKVKGNKKSEQG
jgi:hypothetical protein